MHEPQLPLTCYKCARPIRRKQWVCWNCRAILFADNTWAMGAVFSVLFIGMTMPLYLSLDSAVRRIGFATIVCVGLIVVWISLYRHNKRIREIDRDFVELKREAEKSRRGGGK